MYKAFQKQNWPCLYLFLNNVMGTWMGTERVWSDYLNHSCGAMAHIYLTTWVLTLSTCDPIA